MESTTAIKRRQLTDLTYSKSLSEHAGLPPDVEWECVMFKGPIRQTNPATAPMGPEGLAVHHFGPKEGFKRIYMPVLVDWVNKIFSRGFWSETGPLKSVDYQACPTRSRIYARWFGH